MVKKIIVASGHFSPIHPGHLQYLEAARSLGERLVVIVNNDFQIHLKGSIPFMDQDSRAAIVRALLCVDQVVIAVDRDRSVCETLSLLKPVPAIFANGGDVSCEASCREAELCRKLGIKMAFGVGGNEKNASSSVILRNVREWKAAV